MRSVVATDDSLRKMMVAQEERKIVCVFLCVEHSKQEGSIDVDGSQSSCMHDSITGMAE